MNLEHHEGCLIFGQCKTMVVSGSCVQSNQLSQNAILGGDKYNLLGSLCKKIEFIWVETFLEICHQTTNVHWITSIFNKWITSLSWLANYVLESLKNLPLCYKVRNFWRVILRLYYIILPPDYWHVHVLILWAWFKSRLTVLNVVKWEVLKEPKKEMTMMDKVWKHGCKL
jgi:hypothetical protein